MSKEQVNIPAERVGVLIGTKKRVKTVIEREGNVILDIGTDGVVMISGEDAFRVYKCKNVVKAIGRGFNPTKALKLFNEEVYLKIFDIKDYAGRKKNHILRIKGRLIGKNGKAEKYIERTTGCNFSVYGHTAALIGDYGQVHLAGRAVEMLLKGSEHAVVFGFLRRERMKLLQEDILSIQ